MQDWMLRLLEGAIVGLAKGYSSRGRQVWPPRRFREFSRHEGDRTSPDSGSTDAHLRGIQTVKVFQPYAICLACYSVGT